MDLKIHLMQFLYTHLHITLSHYHSRELYFLAQKRPENKARIGEEVKVKRVILHTNHPLNK